ncbi:LysR family transcriptional regulator [Gordonia sp. CPCC 205515]|uniref:LysR family transcriptional regulator n=1 Tax=Gordonia sp. CPCC 205515 TaxID=3140791 RepID=UPI003AF3BDDA
MPDFTLRQLECFVAVAEYATIAHAADALHASPSAVSGALGELEKHLGEELLVRRRAHGVTLTTAGRALLPRARAVLAAAADLNPDDTEGLSGHLVLGIYRTLSASLLPGIIDGFTRQHPAVRLDFLEGSGDELLHALDEGRADVAILYHRDIYGPVQTEALYELRAHVLLSADHRLAEADSVSLTDLADEPFIQFDVQPAWQNTLALMAAASVRPVIRYATANYELARSMVGRGLGYTVLVNRPVNDLTHEGRRVVVKDLSPLPEPTVVALAWPKDRAPSNLLREFVAWVARPDREWRTETESRG